MFFSFTATRKGTTLTLSGRIETIGNRPFALDLSHIEGDTAHFALVFAPHIGTPDEANQTFSTDVDRTFEVPTNITKMKTHIAGLPNAISAGQPVVAID